MTRLLEVAASVAALALVVLTVGALYVLARHRSRGVVPGAPDRVTDSLVSDLTAELRKWQAEAEYWKRVAERLQRRLDER